MTPLSTLSSLVPYWVDRARNVLEPHADSRLGTHIPLLSDYTVTPNALLEQATDTKHAEEANRMAANIIRVEFCNLAQL